MQPGNNDDDTKKEQKQGHGVSKISQNETTSPASTYKSSIPSAPSIVLPKGGGAIRDIGEKFAANLATGTGSLTLPLSTSPSRDGTGPALSLSYDSGRGNGPFGLGWNLSQPTITRKTDKGLPQYDDANESDVFILAGSEDLVPLYRQDKHGNLVQDAFGNFVFDDTARDGYIVRRYRPRIEGVFVRIERWTRQSDGDTHWRSLTPNNVTTLYGKDNNSCIFSPTDLEDGRQIRVFSWLICESYDSEGNAVVYEYKAENSIGVPVSQPSEGGRTDVTRSANRYIKSIKYGNRQPNRNYDTWAATSPSLLHRDTWMFNIVFDYGEHDVENPSPEEQNAWICREDPFSRYRSCFEVRTYRLCLRVLMFHCFPDDLGVEDCLVYSTEFTYDQSPIFSFLSSVTHSGYVQLTDATSPNRYLKRSLPPVEFDYSKVPDADQLAKLPVQEMDTESIENLPSGVDGSKFSWVDLDGEGLSGIFTSQADGWFYKRNLSAQVLENGKKHPVARLGPLETVMTGPSGTVASPPQFMDLSGGGQIDLVQMEGPVRGFYKRSNDASWLSFREFESWPNIYTGNANLKFVDLRGHGHSDILITEDDVFTWYPSRKEDGFGPANFVYQPLYEDEGPRVIFADGKESVYLADLSGDGMSDLVRIRNGEICYWPNLGYGHFGAKIVMDNAPWFDQPDLFEKQYIRIADIDGCGTADIIYLGQDSVDIYRNQAGNGWSHADHLAPVSPTDQLSTATAVDLLGNGTICLVWSSSLPGDERRSMHYLDLMGGEKPHLLVRYANNLGSETRVQYAPSTYFYLRDREDGRPWATHLPFSVQCVERVDTYDYISRNHFVSRYAYHHGYFDGIEREFNGFGMVEQWDTEEFGALGVDTVFPDAANTSASSSVPPIHTKTWFHTGAFFGNENISRYMAHEYYGAVVDNKTQFEEFWESLLDDTILPSTQLTINEIREACRSLKGSLLRQEVYTDDASLKTDIPYSISERNSTIRLLQRQGHNRHSIFFTHPRETLNYVYERNLDDPRVHHDLVLEVDPYGMVLQSVAIGYGRRRGRSPLQGDNKRAQEQLLITYAKTDITNAVDAPDDYCTPLASQRHTYQLTGFALANGATRFSLATFAANHFASLRALKEIPYEQPSNPELREKRLIDCSRTLYRSNDLSRLLPAGELESMMLPGQDYRVVFTPGLVSSVYQRKNNNATENLLPDPASVLGGQETDQAAYVDLDNNGNWWIPSGRVYYHPNPNISPQQELMEARTHFFVQRCFTDPFGNSSTANYDRYSLLLASIKDAMENIIESVNNYRVLEPFLVTDPNGNRVEAAFDALGMVVGTATMGKITESLGDSLTGFRADLTQDEIDIFFARPKVESLEVSLLGNATTRIIYDVNRYWLELDPKKKQPAFSAALARETHVSDPVPPGGLKIKVNFSYSDGCGREIQKKIQAEPGHVEGVSGIVDPRWVGSGWTIYNNKGKPVRQYEPFFDDTHDFKFAKMIGVSSTLFYDPLGRVISTLNADSSWEKVVFNPWQQIAYDANDTVLFNPGTDQDVGEYFQRLPASDYLPTWYEARKSGELGRDEQSSAMKTAVHFDTPTVAHFDALGRTILTIEDNGSYGKYATHVLLDIEGNHLQVIDAKDRIVMRYNYDMINTQIHQSSMEGGERWTLNNAVGNPFLAWNSRNFRIRNVDDPLHRRILSYLQDGTSPEHQVERIVYGETLSNPEIRNQRGKTVQIYDQAGLVVNDDYDFKGNLLSSQRQFAEDYKTTPDWSFVVPLETQLYTNYTEYDALNRVTQLTTPDDSLTHLIYNEANFIGQVQVSLHAENTNSQLSWTPFVTNIEYDPKGQRTLIAYGNGIHTRYTYDHYTFRLNHLKTRRDFTPLQDLHYTYDPVGNVTHIRDDAQQTVFFRNNRVDPSNDYTYDPIYRLVEATGREHLGLGSKGQTGPPPVPNAFNAFETRVDHPGNGNAMQSYFEKYIYDSVNNILAVKHDGSDATHPGWTRSYNYNEPSQLEPSKTSNRLSSTAVGGRTETYSYDGSAGLDGLMTKMPQLSFLQWDYKDQLQTTSRQVIQNGGTPETTWYVYDGSGQRVRKITERQSTGGQSTGGQKPTRMKERIYLGVFEIYREYENDGSTVSLERETLHVMDDKQRIALVETRTQGTDDAPEQLMRYQFGNLLGSVCLELDEQAQIISYEEYYPFGSTSYQAVRSKLETPKRYRYTGKERDEESGLYYYGARYYASWLGRWISCDPKGIADGDNLYHYVHNNPIKNNDPTGTLTLGQWSGIAAAVVVGTVLTVATAGLAGPVVGTAAAAIIGGIVGGAAGGAVGAAVESKIDQGHVDMDAVGKGALVGAITGGALSGGGVAASAIARSTIGRAVGTGIAKSAAGQFVGNTAKSVTSSSAAKAVSSGAQTLSNSSIGRAATSAIETGIANPLRSLSEYTEGLGSRFSLATGIGKEASRQAGLDATGARLATMLKTGPSGGNKAIAAAEISGPEYKGSPVLRTRSGMATPAGEQEIPHVPLSKETHFHTFPIPKGNGDMSQEAVRIANFKDAALNDPSREVDAEVRMYNGVTEKGAKKLNMAVNKPMCMSCVHATFQFLGDNPGLELNLWAPPSVGDSFLDLGSLGPFALTPSVTKATVAGATGAVAGTYNAF